MKEAILFLFSIALYLGFLAAFYKLPLFLIFPLISPSFFYFERRKVFLFLFFLLSFYFLGKFYLFNKELRRTPEKERFIFKVERVEPYYEGFRVFAQAEALGLIEFTTKKGGLKPGLLCEASFAEKRWYKRWNPFFPEEKEIFQLREVEGIFKLLEKEEIYCVEDKGNFIEKMRFKLFQFSESLSPLAKGLFLALVLGVENQLPREYLETLKNQGLYHQLAISGFNLAILYGLLYKFFRFSLGYTNLIRFEIPLQIWAYLLALPGALLVLIFSGFQPPALRAFLFLSIYLLSKILFRSTPSVLLLFLTADILLILKPALIGSASFQLSFLATLALILGDSFFREKLAKRISFNFLEKLLYGLFISVLVSLFVFPIIINLSGEIPLATPLNNLIATPFWSFIFIPFSLFSALIFFISEKGATLLMEGVAFVFSLYQKIPLFEFLFRPSLPVNLFLLFWFSSLIVSLIIWKLKLRNFHKIALIVLISLGGYFVLTSLYERTAFFVLPKFFTMRAYLIKDGKDFYLITREREESSLERDLIFIPLLRKLGVEKLEGVLFLEKSPLEEYQRHFAIEKEFQTYDLLFLERRIFERGPEFIPLSSKAFLIEYKGFSLLEYQGKEKPGLKAEFSLSTFFDSQKREVAYFFFPKENYILMLTEKERRESIWASLFFPLIPYYIEEKKGLRLDYQKSP